MRNPRRTAVTASALVIGLALVGLTATFGASAKASVRKDTASGLLADYVVKTDGFAGFSTDVAERLGELPELDAVVPMRVVDGAVDGEVDTVGAVDPARLEDVVSLDFVSGGVEGLDAEPGGVLVDDVIARREDRTPVTSSAAVLARQRPGRGPGCLPQRELHRHLRPGDPDRPSRQVHSISARGRTSRTRSCS